ncbi:hypothetical protein [Agromyces seonyuensis]|uniref:Uncharacterized protein n=1 Tax=Agromyces seonyuensis TaxID=2662446 RepID=A0A6I4NYS9_9MICO|nr:hypothetical protein [Agromyces seonyuensis]MWB99530.1 hypothetical protein [Agromyces seonyuensis]
MDWTFWAGLGAIVVLWAATQWFFSWWRHSEKVRGRNREQADGIADAERQKERGRFWGGL